jgi:hypothetical protein
MNPGDLISTGDGGYAAFRAWWYSPKLSLVSFVAFSADGGGFVMVPETTLEGIQTPLQDELGNLLEAPFQSQSYTSMPVSSLAFVLLNK